MLISKHRFYLVWAIIISLFMLGCAKCITRDWGDRADIKGDITVKYDNFKKVWKYVGPDKYENKKGLFDSQRYFLRAFKSDKTNKTIYQIYVITTSGHWRYQDSAYDNDGNKLDVTVIDRKVGFCDHQLGCSLHEHVGINISEDYLRTYRTTNLKIEVSGSAGDNIIEIPATYTETFMDFVNQN